MATIVVHAPANKPMKLTVAFGARSLSAIRWTACPAGEKHMNDSPESVVRGFLALWSDPQAEKLAKFFAEDAVRVDGPNGVHHGAKAIVDEFTRQLSIFRGQWVKVDALVADGGTVMVEWHGGSPQAAGRSTQGSWPPSKSTRTVGSDRCARAST